VQHHSTILKPSNGNYTAKLAKGISMANHQPGNRKNCPHQNPPFAAPQQFIRVTGKSATSVNNVSHLAWYHRLGLEHGDQLGHWRRSDQRCDTFLLSPNRPFSGHHTRPKCFHQRACR
jgi:hypothetical protein